MHSASMIKFFLLAYAMELIHDGQLSLGIFLGAKKFSRNANKDEPDHLYLGQARFGY